MILKQMPAIDAAINEESWEWLGDNVPVLASAVQEEVKRGAQADEIRRHVMIKTQREALALRCQQAAAYLIAMKGSK